MNENILILLILTVSLWNISNAEKCDCGKTFNCGCMRDRASSNASCAIG